MNALARMTLQKPTSPEKAPSGGLDFSTDILPILISVVATFVVTLIGQAVMERWKNSRADARESRDETRQREREQREEDRAAAREDRDEKRAIQRERAAADRERIAEAREREKTACEQLLILLDELNDLLPNKRHANDPAISSRSYDALNEFIGKTDFVERHLAGRLRAVHEILTWVDEIATTNAYSEATHFHGVGAIVHNCRRETQSWIAANLRGDPLPAKSETMIQYEVALAHNWELRREAYWVESQEYAEEEQAWMAAHNEFANANMKAIEEQKKYLKDYQRRRFGA